MKYGEALHRYPNLLNRDFTAEIPNQKWITDISCIRTGQGFLCRSAICDLYDNSIVACKAETGQTVHLVLSALRTARKKKRSLQSCNHTETRAFGIPLKRTQEYGITPSMSRRGNSYANALTENFFSILKTEYICQARIASFEETRRLIDDDIYFYNHERIQLRTK